MSDSGTTSLTTRAEETRALVERYYDAASQSLRQRNKDYETRFHQDALGRPYKKDMPGGLVSWMFYDSVGRIRGKTDDNGVLTDIRYNALGHVTEIRRHREPGVQ